MTSLRPDVLRRMVAEEADIVSHIRAAVDPARFEFDTAEDRAAFDHALRDELRKIEDERVRTHAAEMLKLWRWQLFGMPASLDPVVAALHERLKAVEAVLGVNQPREITSRRESDG